MNIRRYFVSRRALRAGTGLFALALAGGFASGAGAQTVPAAAPEPGETAAQGEAIVVTGSRIRRDPLDQAAPVTGVEQADIARTGLSSIADVLQRLPGSAGGLNSRFNRSGNNGNPPDGGGVGAGSAEIDLRYLSSRRTLVLVDGLRFINGSAASGIPGAVDLNAIPEAMIDRVEVLRDGASTTYGSDAIAGVVNIITKKRQNGFLATAQVGAYEQGDGVTQNYQLSWGTESQDSGTSIVIGGNYIKQDSVFAGDRAHYAYPTPGQTACDSNCSSASANGRFILSNPLNGDPLNLTLKAPVAGRPVFDPLNPTGAGSSFKAFTNADRYNFRPANYLVTPYQRYGGFLTFRQRIADNVNFNAKVVLNRRTSDNQAAPLPLFVGPDAGNGNLLDTISIDSTNPYNPFGVTLSAGGNGTPANYNYIARRFLEIGPRHFSQTVDTFYLTGGFDGQLQIGGGTWYWDTTVIYAENHAKQSMNRNVHAGNLATALGPVSQCTGACVPFNLFGGNGSITPAMIDYVTFIQRDRSEQSMVDATFNLSGNLFQLPGGPLGTAFGYEYRRNSGSFDPDPIVAAGLGSDIPAQPSRGRFDVHEVYGELNAPLLRNVPFFSLLEASFAARYSSYSTSGSKTTLKAGLSWKPVDDLRLRGTWAQGFRAPSIGELFGAPSRFDGSVQDPCSDFRNSGVSNTVIQNCIAQGVPANGSYVQSNGEIGILTGGNRNLKPETSTSWVVGGVYSPSWATNTGWARALTLEADYYTIKVDDAIASIDAQVLLANCTQRADPIACAAIPRTASGTITRINGVLQNIASIKSEGVDIILSYRSPDVAGGTIGVTWSSNILLEYATTLPSATGPTTISEKGLERGSQAYPRYKGNIVLDWSNDRFHAAVTGRFVSKVTEPGYNDHVMGNTFYTDLQLGWTPPVWNERFTLTLGVNNLFARQAPDCLSCGGFDPTTYDMPDRFGYVRLAARF